MPEQKEVEDMKEFMTVLMDVKVSLAEQNQKLDNLLDIKPKIEEAHDLAKGAYSRSKRNEELLKDKADKEDVKRIVDEKDNWQRNLPAWIAVVISVIVFLSQFITI